MKKLLCSLSLYLCIYCFSLSQEVSPITNDEFTKFLREKTEAQERAKWDYNLGKIYRVTSDPSVYQDLLTEVSSRISNSKEINAIAELVNPSSTKLGGGKSYNDIILNTAEEVFQLKPNNGDASDVAQTKSRLSSIIMNLTNPEINEKGNVIGGIVRGIVSTTPVLDLASKVIGGLCTFFKSTKVGRANTEYSETLEQDKIIKFKSKLDPYIKFYDSALALNKNFGQELDAIKAEALKLDVQSKNATESLKKSVSNITGNSNFGLQEIQEKFPFNFEALYKGSYNVEYYKLALLADSIININLEVNKMREQLNILTNSYISDIAKLVEDYPKQEKQGTVAFEPNSLKTEIEKMQKSLPAEELSDGQKDIVFLSTTYNAPSNLSFESSDDGAYSFSIDKREDNLILPLTVGLAILFGGLIFTYFSLNSRIKNQIIK